MHTIKQLLEQLGLLQYAEVFARNDVDLAALRLLAESDFEKLGVSLGHRKKLLKAVSELDWGVALTPPASPIQASPLTLERESIGAEGERRQLTVLFCDMVGFTDLASRVDPEILQRIIRSYEDACAVCITRYEGYVFQRLGDGIVAFFGYPLAHEGEAERAIRAGLEIVETLSKFDVPDAGQLAVRIGVATGLVVVSSAEKGAVGETMNLAARLQAIAQPGSIVVSERVHRLAGGSFDYEDLGKQTLKGIAQPTHAYRILGVSQAASRFEAATQKGLTPLVGREQEIGLLLERWALAQDGEGQVVLLSGEPGIGKSRILSALRERLEETGAGTLRFQCSPYYVNSAFWPSIDNFERALKFARDEQPESKLDKLEALIVTHYGRPLSDVRFIAAMLSIPCEARYGALSMTPQKHKDETLRTLVDLIEAAARKQPSVMLYEDAHWADPTTLEMLDLLIIRVRTIPLLIVLTHRQEFQSRWSSQGHVGALNLSKLTRAQSAAIVSRLAGGKALPAELLEQILAKTDGVPLFVEELTKSIVESGELKDTGNRYEYSAAAHTVTIPATLRDSLLARLDRLAPVKEIAQIGACIGREFSYDVLAGVSTLGNEQLEQALQTLVAAGLVYRRGTPPDATYTFKHALVQDAAYDSLLHSRRQSFHKRIALVLEAHFPEVVEANPEVIADHYTRASQPEAAVNYWLRAGERARYRMAVKEGLQHFARGMETLRQCPESIDRDRTEFRIQRNIALLYFIRSGYQSQEAAVALRRASQLIDLANDDVETYCVHMGLLHSVFHRGIVAEMRTISRAAVEHAERHSGPIAQLDANLVSGVAEMWSGHWRQATEYSQRAASYHDAKLCRTLHREAGFDPRIEVAIIDGYCLWLLGYEERARAAAEASLRISMEESDAYGIAMAYSYTGADLHYWMRDFEASRRFAEVSVRVAVENEGFGHVELLARFQLGASRARMGDVDAGVAAAGDALASLIAGGATSFIPRLTAELAELHGLNGHINEALRMLEESPDRKVKGGRPTKFPEIFRIEGVLLAAAGRDDEAEACLREALAIARADESLSFELRAAVELGRFLARHGRHREVPDLLRPVVDAIPEARDRPDMRDADDLFKKMN